MSWKQLPISTALLLREQCSLIYEGKVEVNLTPPKLNVVFSVSFLLSHKRERKVEDKE